MYISSSVTPGVNSSTSKLGAYDKISKTRESSETEKLEAFKKDIWGKINLMPYSKNINVSIQITDEAFKRMMKEPKFKDEMMSTLMEDAIASNTPPIGTTLTWIDENGYRGYSYCQGGDEAFAAHSNNKNSFYSRKAKKKSDHAKLWQERNFEKTVEQKKLDQKHKDAFEDKGLLLQKATAANIYEGSTYSLEFQSDIYKKD